jgi:hypothetical protein
LADEFCLCRIDLRVADDHAWDELLNRRQNYGTERGQIAGSGHFLKKCPNSLKIR